MKTKTFELIGIFAYAFMIFGIGVFAWFIINEAEVQDYNSFNETEMLRYNDLSNTLKLIEDNCDSTFITKKYGEKGWFIYVNKCKDNGYCKYKYIKLEDCLE